MNRKFKKDLLRFYRKSDHYAASNDIEIVDVKEGQGKAQARISSKHLNGLGIAHGGIIFSLADVAFGLAANSHGREALTLNADMAFFNPAREGMLITAEAKELSLRHTIATYFVTIKNEEGILIASGKYQAYRKKEIISPEIS